MSGNEKLTIVIDAHILNTARKSHTTCLLYPFQITRMVKDKPAYKKHRSNDTPDNNWSFVAHAMRSNY